MTHFAPAFACALALLAATAAAQDAAPALQPTGSAVWSNSLGMAFVRIPAGSFAMGSAEDPEVLARDFPLLERQRFELLADEAPVHQVRISRAFYMGQHEVTVGQFRRFIEASGYRPEPE
ncbi:formylglycine-generating enzyme family protein, partial [Acidovorax cavernicola]